MTKHRYSLDKPKLIKAVNNILKYLKTTADLSIYFDSYDVESLCTRSYSNTSYVKDYDNTSQLGFVMYLVDPSNSCQHIYWSLLKAKIATGSVLERKSMALADAFDVSFTI